MRHVPLVFLAALSLSWTAINCGGESSPSVALVPGASGLGGNNPQDGAGESGSGANGLTNGSGGGQVVATPTKSSSDQNTPGAGGGESSAASGKPAPGAGGGPQAAIEGCDVPSDPSTTTTITATVPDANWFSSATQARALLKLGLAPIPSLVRDGDFLAYYAIRSTSTVPIDNPAAALEITPFMGPGASPVQSIVQLGVQAAGVDPKTRPAASITFLLDTSSSMAGRSMTIAREAMAAIAKNLTTGDAVNVVTTLPGGMPQELVLLKPLDPKVINALENAVTDGGEDIPGALVKAYDEAKKSYKPGGLNRVVFISDGGALPASIDTNLVTTRAAPGAQGDIRLVGVGTGDEPGYNPALLEVAATAGRGALLYLNDVADADAELGVRFDEVLGVGATNVKLALKFPWYFSPDDAGSAVFGGNSSELVTADLGPGAALTFRQALRVCNPQIIGYMDTIEATVTWTTPLSSALQSASVDAVIDTLQNASSVQVRKGTAILAYTEALRTLDPKRLTNAYNLATELAPNDPDLVEVASLIQMHPAFPKQ